MLKNLLYQTPLLAIPMVYSAVFSSAFFWALWGIGVQSTMLGVVCLLLSGMVIFFISAYTALMPYTREIQRSFPQWPDPISQGDVRFLVVYLCVCVIICSTFLIVLNVFQTNHSRTIIVVWAVLASISYLGCLFGIRAGIHFTKK